MKDPNEADIQSTIRGWPTLELLRSRVQSQNWSLVSFDYAISRVSVDTDANARRQTTEWLNQLRREWIDERRHQELLEVARKNDVAETIARGGEPTEISESLARLRRDYPPGTPLGFILMSFAKTPAHDAICRAIREGCQRRGIRAVRADDREYHDDLYWNVATYLHAADFGVAVFERLQKDAFNPNVSFELGYLFALRKPALLLKDQTLPTLHADLMGKLYRTFDPQSPDENIPRTVETWLEEKGLGDRGILAADVASARYGAGDHWQDVTRAVRVWLTSGQPALSVSNVALGGDPAYGAIKELEVQLRTHQDPISVPEGGILRPIDLRPKR